MKEFDIWIWSSKINWKSTEEKLISFYQAEIASKSPSNLSKLWDNTAYNFENIKKISDDIINIEKNLVDKYNWKKIEIWWVNYDIIVDWQISPILLREVRKWNMMWNDYIYKEIQKYIEKLNSWFDFISPYIKKKI